MAYAKSVLNSVISTPGASLPGRPWVNACAVPSLSIDDMVALMTSALVYSMEESLMSTADAP